MYNGSGGEMGRSTVSRARPKAAEPQSVESSLTGLAAPTPPIPPVTQVESPSAPTLQPTPPVAPLSKGVERWRRAHDSKSRKKVAKILVLKMAGHSTAQVAEKLGISPENVRHYLYLAGKNGWLNGGAELVEPSEVLAFETAHKVVRNISRTLDGHFATDQQHEMTIEAAKGLGLFKTHQVVKNEGQQGAAPVLEMRIVNVQVAAPQALPVETIGGQAAYIDGESLPVVLTLPEPKDPGAN